MAAVRSALSARGASQAVVDLVALAHRPGTQDVYKTHWQSWSSWCWDHQVDPTAPPPVELANYLAFLSTERKLASSTVKTHRSAISTTIRQLGGPSFSDDPLLHDVVRAADQQDARSPRVFPAWDLFLVLASLRRPPYEPIRECSLKHLFEKTAFLVSLASGRRCSEIHALSEQSVATEPDGSVSLRFVPGFLAKNQPNSAKSPPLFIRSLCAILGRDDEDRFLCPVRALRAYRKRSAHLRCPGKRRLFISYKESMQTDISKATLSRWLKNVIKAAYASPEVVSAPNSSRPHEIRAWASSLAWVHNTSMTDILDAAYWFNQGTFIDHYLRDVSRVNSDNSRGIASVVVAQQAISVSRSNKLPSTRK